MKKVVAVIGSPRAGDTYDSVRLFEEKLKEICVCDFEYIQLKDFDIKPCRGCLTCVTKGEKYCPIKDDVAGIMEKLLSANGVVFATPVYSLNISGQLKMFIDRIAYVFHRPCFFDKAFIGITVQAINGYKDAHAYLYKIAHVWGFTAAPGLALNTPPGFRSAGLLQKNREKTEKAVKNFCAVMNAKKLKMPSLKDFIIFRMTRYFITYIPFMAKDSEYYQEKGWMESDYYYPIRISFIRKFIGRFFDMQGRKLGEKVRARREKETQTPGA